MKFLKLILMFLILPSCTGAIPDHNLIPMNLTSLESIKSGINLYNKRIIKKADILSNITFKYHGRSMSVLGITSINEENRAYNVAALNPMGVTVFQLKVKDDKIVSSYIIPMFTQGKNMKNNRNNADKAARMISSDIACIYFNRSVNQELLDIRHRKNRIVLKSILKENQYYKYIFAGRPLRLITKIKYKNSRKIWSVDYYDYQKKDIFLMPFKIILRNHEYGYRLEIQTKKVTI